MFYFKHVPMIRVILKNASISNMQVYIIDKKTKSLHFHALAFLL